MKLGSLFDGSGGFPLAGAMHGITPMWASEIEPYPIKVTKARFPGMKHLGSVLDVNGAEAEPVDIITFGSPCQDLSVAGKQAGLHKGERSNLFFEAIRIIKEMRESTNGKYPRIAVWENVPGAYSSNKGEDFRAVLRAFCQVCDPTADVPMPPKKWHKSGAIVGDGWSVAWRTFDAQYWGVPQRRKRIYLIADFGSERAGEILFEQEGLRRHPAESGTAREGTSGNAEGSPRGGRECLTPWDVQSKRIYREDSKWPGLCTGKRICDGSVLISAADAERGVGGDCEIVGFQSSQSGFRLCATHATLDANNGSRRQNGVCYPAPGGAEGSAGRSGECLTPWDVQSRRVHDDSGAWPAIYGGEGGGHGYVLRQATPADAEGSVGRGSVRCLNSDHPQTSRIYDADGVYPCLSSNASGGLNRQAVCFQQNQRDEVRSLGDKTGAIAANSGAHQTNYICEKVDLIRESRGAFEAYEEDAQASGALKQSDYKGAQVVAFEPGISQRIGVRAWGDISPTLRAEAGDNKPAVCYPINTMVATRWNKDDNRTTFGIGEPGDPQFTLGAAHEHGVCYAVRTAQTNANGIGVAQDAHTLDGANAQAVCYSVDCRNMNLTKEHGTLQAKENGGQSLNYMGAVCYAVQACGDRDNPSVSVSDTAYCLPANPMSDRGQSVCYPIDSHQQDSRFRVCDDGIAPTLPGQMGTGGNNGPMVLETTKPSRKYIIRRLTPLECCRLQGFPDYWCSGLGTENPSDDEILFWAGVWETHRKILGKSSKPKSRRQIVKWLQDPYSDSAEYTMFGNGIAMPNAIYVIGCAKKLILEG